MLRRLLIALAQVPAGNNLKTWICLKIYLLYQAKENTEKVYNNVMNSINAYRMDTICEFWKL